MWTAAEINELQPLQERTALENMLLSPGCRAQIEFLVDPQVNTRHVLIGASYTGNPLEERNVNKVRYGAIRLDDYAEGGTLNNHVYSDILRPEVTLQNTPQGHIAWSHRLNAAFIIAAMRSGRPIELITNTGYYQEILNDKRSWRARIFNNGAFWELVALQACGYTISNIKNQRFLVDSVGADSYIERVKNIFELYQAVGPEANFPGLIGHERYQECLLHLNNFAQLLGLQLLQPQQVQQNLQQQPNQVVQPNQVMPGQLSVAQQILQPQQVQQNLQQQPNQVVQPNQVMPGQLPVAQQIQPQQVQNQGRSKLKTFISKLEGLISQIRFKKVLVGFFLFSPIRVVNDRRTHIIPTLKSQDPEVPFKSPHSFSEEIVNLRDSFSKIQKTGSFTTLIPPLSQPLMFVNKRELSLEKKERNDRVSPEEKEKLIKILIKDQNKLSQKEEETLKELLISKHIDEKSSSIEDTILIKLLMKAYKNGLLNKLESETLEVLLASKQMRGDLSSKERRALEAIEENRIREKP